jgi:hypothetical protein
MASREDIIEAAAQTHWAPTNSRSEQPGYATRTIVFLLLPLISFIACLLGYVKRRTERGINGVADASPSLLRMLANIRRARIGEVSPSNVDI